MRRPLVALLALALAGCAPEVPPAADVTAFVDVAVIDGTGAPPIPGRTVLVRNGVIEAVGPAAEIEVPAGARTVDGEGRTLLPGLIDLHVHLSKARAPALPLMVTYGVTTVRDAGGDTEELLRWRREARAGERLAPRMRIAGPYLESPENVERMREAHDAGTMVEPVRHTRIPVDGPERARVVVDSIAALGVDFVKFRTVASMETFRAMVAAADSTGLDAAGHTFGIPLEAVIDAGLGSVEHFLFPLMDEMPEAERRALFGRMAAAGVAIVPTLVTWEESTFAADSVLDALVADSGGTRWPDRPLLSRYLLLDWREQLSERGEGDGIDWEAVHRSTLRNLREMHAEGVAVLPGSDLAVLGVLPGSSLHAELELLVRDVGLTPVQALSAATLGAARLLGLTDSVGTVEPGKRADLVLVEGDPAANVSATRAIAGVMLDGRWLDRPALDSIRAGIRDDPAIRVNDWRTGDG